MRSLAIICVPMFLVLLDVNIVNVALPEIGNSFDVAAGRWSYVVDFYTLPVAASLIIAGRITDRVGYKAMLAVGEAIFLAGSIVATAASAWPVILAARTIQGLGAAAMLPASLAALTALWQDRAARAKALGIWSSVSASATALGPVVGGLLIAAASWRLIFAINIPLCAIALAGLMRLPSAPTTRAKNDGSLRLGPLSGATIAAFLMTAVGNGVLIAVVMYLQHAAGYSALTTGLLMLIATAPFAAFGPVTGRLMHRFGRRPIAATGFTAGAMLILTLTGTSASGNLAWIAVGLLGIGIGLGLITASIVGEGMEAIPAAQGLAGGINNTARQFGTSVGVAISGAIVGSQTDFLTGVHHVSWLAGSGWILGAIIVLTLFTRTKQR
jgi:DHA2 family methylenomycin A resistance protein-like MFS transporter